jgi:hypothetical protein
VLALVADGLRDATSPSPRASDAQSGTMCRRFWQTRRRRAPKTSARCAWACPSRRRGCGPLCPLRRERAMIAASIGSRAPDDRAGGDVCSAQSAALVPHPRRGKLGQRARGSPADRVQGSPPPPGPRSPPDGHTIGLPSHAAYGAQSAPAHRSDSAVAPGTRRPGNRPVTHRLRCVERGRRAP